ncbi:MAG: hypothetical protein HYV27_20100 [Candidatus Hydrogenedentes bacterium]|nr:hypothetical protein [Candidatus Hydrogenedentota bacterium]
MQIVVLGMRSGSSVITRLINMLGASVGPSEQMMKPSIQNPKGFWEHEAVVLLNNRLLKTQGCVWNSIGPFDGRNVLPGAYPEHADEARKLLAELDQARPWVLKDPRMSLLMPFWRPLLEKPVIAIIYRHPLEVARSLKTHHTMPLLCGLALWEQYTRTLLRDSIGMPRLLVSYNALMQDPVAQLKTIHDRLTAYGAIPLCMPATEAIGEFVEPAFYREKHDAAEVAAMMCPEQQRLFEALEDASALAWPEVPEISLRSLEMLRTYDELHLRRWNESVMQKRLKEAELRAAALEQQLAPKG